MSDVREAHGNSGKRRPNKPLSKRYSAMDFATNQPSTSQVRSLQHVTQNYAQGDHGDHDSNGRPQVSIFPIHL
jgi:hypothetical protein